MWKRLSIHSSAFSAFTFICENEFSFLRFLVAGTEMIQKKIVCAKHSVTQLHKIVLEYTQSVEFHEKALNVRVFHVKQIQFTCTSREERVTGTSLTRASFNDRRSFEFHETQTSMCYPTTSGFIFT